MHKYSEFTPSLLQMYRLGMRRMLINFDRSVRISGDITRPVNGENVIGGVAYCSLLSRYFFLSTYLLMFQLVNFLLPKTKTKK